MGKLSAAWSREFFQKGRDTHITDKFEAFLEHWSYYIFQSSPSVALVLSQANPLTSTYIIPASVRHRLEFSYQIVSFSVYSFYYIFCLTLATQGYLTNNRNQDLRNNNFVCCFVWV